MATTEHKNTIKDIGPQPQSFDIERETKENTNYRSVAWSGRYLQLTLMSIPVGGDIGLEAHPETDQFLRLDAGSGRRRRGRCSQNMRSISTGDRYWALRGHGSMSDLSPLLSGLKQKLDFGAVTAAFDALADK